MIFGKKTFYLSSIVLLLISLCILYLLRIKKDSALERIIIITIDTLRADHLGSYDYVQKVSPFIDSLGQQGILFKNAFASMSTTAPSHASLFTSLYPLQHGVSKNGHKLADSFLTMAEIFQDMGYKTAGIVSTDRHFAAANIDQGFEYFNEPMDLLGFKMTKKSVEELRQKGVPDKILENLLSLENKTFTDKTNFMNALEERMGKKQRANFQEVIVQHAELDLRYRKAGETIDVALNWLDTVQPDQNFFLWIHLFDAHTPLRPPEVHFEKVANLLKDKELFTYLLNEHHIDFGYFDRKKTEMLREIRSYDAEIHYADSELQRFFQVYQTKEFDSKSLLVITSDHGEGLGNHNLRLHGKHIYNEQLRVPLMFYFSSRLGQGTLVEHVIENVDIFPTIFEFIGSDPRYFESIEGESLTPFILSKPGRTYQKKYAFSQRRVYDSSSSTPNPDHEEGEKYALQTRDYKYIYRTHGRDEFFDLRNDPYEINNTINRNSEKEQHLKDSLLMKIEKLKRALPSKRLSVDRETIERLKSLGYIQ